MQFKNIGGKGFSKDASKGIHIGRSSVFAAMQIGLWMGYEKIYIFGCLPDGEKILTSRGMVAIDLLDDTDFVYTTDGFMQPTGYQRRWCDGTLVSLITHMNNIPLRVTGEHPVLVRRNGHDDFINASQLSIGDVAVYPIDMTMIDHEEKDDFWWLVGVYAAEGYIRKIRSKYHYATLCLGKHEVDFQQKVTKKVAAVLNCKTTSDYKNRTASEQIINNDRFGRFVIEHIGRGSHDKFISNTIMQLPLQKQAAFIAGYCEGDGSLYNRKRTNTDECTFSTASESIAECLQKILLRFGVIASIVRSKRSSGFDRTNSGSFGTRHHIHIIGSSLDILAQWCNWNIKTSGKESLFNTCIENNKLLVKIRQITHSEFSGYVNNIEIEGPHTFASRLLMTHNCDMNPDGINGKLHFYGDNPDVDPGTRKNRFKDEAVHYDHAATILNPEERSKFVFCTEYNTWGFIKEFGHMSHKDAVEHIIEQANNL
tara:strand:- start:164 stop:1609 length:1446 start_codon:yes stop_codon:yes gene_type:complete